MNTIKTLKYSTCYSNMRIHTLFPLGVILPPAPYKKKKKKAQECTRLAAAGSVMECSNETLQQAKAPMNQTLGACLSEVWAPVSPHHYSFTQQSPH